MFNSLKNFVSALAGGSAAPDRFEERDYRLAATALLIHVIAVDGAISAVEHEKLFSLVKRGFTLDDVAAAELIAQATDADRDAIDLYGFTSLIDRTVDVDGRRRIIEMMWEIIYADGHVNEFEDNAVWRVADLLHLPSRERVEIRRRVAGRVSPVTARPSG